MCRESEIHLLTIFSRLLGGGISYKVCSRCHKKSYMGVKTQYKDGTDQNNIPSKGIAVNI
jgi:hypothetical protein